VWSYRVNSSSKLPIFAGTSLSERTSPLCESGSPTRFHVLVKRARAVNDSGTASSLKFPCSCLVVPDSIRKLLKNLKELCVAVTKTRKGLLVVLVLIIVIGTAAYFVLAPKPTQPGFIGKEGGVVSAEGASVEIPAGALEEDVEITVQKLDEETLPAPMPAFTEFLGAASFGPDGLVFKTNVTITIPLKEAQTPGKALSLYRYEPDKGFIDTGISAIVSEEGTSASAEVSAFSIYSLFDGLTAQAGAGVFEEARDQGLSIDDAFKEWWTTFAI